LREARETLPLPNGTVTLAARRIMLCYQRCEGTTPIVERAATLPVATDDRESRRPGVRGIELVKYGLRAIRLLP
jgi:hypothetical protein